MSSHELKGFQVISQNLNDEKEDTEIDVDSTCLDFGKSDIPDSMERDDLYHTNWLLLFPFFASLCLVIGYNRQTYFGINETKVIYYLFLIISIIVACISFVIIIYGIYNKYIIKIKSITESINRLFIHDGGKYHTQHPFLKLVIFRCETSMVLYIVFLLFYASIDLIIAFTNVLLWYLIRKRQNKLGSFTHELSEYVL